MRWLDANRNDQRFLGCLAPCSRRGAGRALVCLAARPGV